MIDFIVGYSLIYLSLCFHEAMHSICALAFKIPLAKIQIGADWLQIHFGILYISPIFGTSFVETETEKLEKAPKKHKILFFLSGAVGNVLLSVIFGILFFWSKKIMLIIASMINIIMAISSLIPFKNTDIGILLSFIKAK